MLGKTCLFLVGILCFATPITSIIPVVVGFDSYFYNLGLRLVYLTISLYLLIASFAHPSTNRIAWGGWLMLIFWAIYSTRFIHDTIILGIVIRGSLFKLYAITFGNCLISAIAIIRTARFIPVDKALKFLFYLLMLANIFVLASLLYTHGSLNPAVLGRARFMVELDSGKSLDILNPITIGFHGECLALFALGVRLFASKEVVRNWLANLGFALGIFVLVLGASRGPALGTAVGVLVIVFTYLYAFRKTAINLLKVIGTVLAIVATVYFWVLPKLVDLNFTLLTRLTDLADNLSSADGEREIRSYQWESAIDMFVSNPIIGDRYLERYVGFYPHNVYLEVLMSTGVVGAIPFFAMLSFSFFYFIRCIKSRNSRLVLFFPLFAIFMWMFTSGSIFEGVALWTFISFWIGMNGSYAMREVNLNKK